MEETKYIQMNIRTDKYFAEAIDKERLREDRSRSSMIRVLVMEALKQREKFTDRIITK